MLCFFFRVIMFLCGGLRIQWLTRPQSQTQLFSEPMQTTQMCKQTQGQIGSRGYVTWRETVQACGIQMQKFTAPLPV